MRNLGVWLWLLAHRFQHPVEWELLVRINSMLWMSGSDITVIAKEVFPTLTRNQSMAESERIAGVLGLRRSKGTEAMPYGYVLLPVGLRCGHRYSRTQFRMGRFVPRIG